MSGGPPMLPPVGPPAEVQIYILPPVAGGQYSLFTYPRRAGDTRVAYTPPGSHPTPGKAREALWVPNGLRTGQVLTIQEKASSPMKGVFQGLPFTLHSGMPFKLSGPPVKGPKTAREGTWSYEIMLSDGTGIIARLDPDIVIIEDP